MKDIQNVVDILCFLKGAWNQFEIKPMGTVVHILEENVCAWIHCFTKCRPKQLIAQLS